MLLLATVRLQSGFSIEHFGVWIFLSKVIYFLYFLSLQTHASSKKKKKEKENRHRPVLPDHRRVPLAICFPHDYERTSFYLVSP